MLHIICWIYISNLFSFFYLCISGDFDLTENESDENNSDEDNDEANMEKYVNLANHPYSSLSHLNEQDYGVQETSKYVLAYISGYIVRKCQKFSSCEDCLAVLKSRKKRDHDRLIEIASKGYLMFPSQRYVF